MKSPLTGIRSQLTDIGYKIGQATQALAILALATVALAIVCAVHMMRH